MATTSWRSTAAVEVDQWFWPLFKSDTPVLPRTDVVREYADSVQLGLVFSIKVPNSITLTHHYRKYKGAVLVVNPHFLSTGLMARFLQAIEPLGDHIGPLMCQFEYLNRQKMANLHRFLELFEVFRGGLPTGLRYCAEIRDPNWLRAEYFEYLAEHHLGHVFLQGYYLPPIFGCTGRTRKNWPARWSHPPTRQRPERDGRAYRQPLGPDCRAEGRRTGQTGENGSRPAPAQPRHLHQRQQPLRGFRTQDHREIRGVAGRSGPVMTPQDI